MKKEIISRLQTALWGTNTGNVMLLAKKIYKIIEPEMNRLSLAEKVCEFTLELWNMDELYLTAEDKRALNAWRRAKEGGK